MEIAKYIELGEKLGYTGAELREFVKDREREVKEEKDREKEERRLARELEKEKIEREEKRIASESEKERIAMELEKEKMEREERKLALEYENREKERQYELELERIKASEIKQENNASGEASGSDRKIIKPFKLPVFDENKDDMHVYLTRFEHYAKMVKWDKEYWAFQLGNLLKGEAANVFARLMQGEKTGDYDELKSELLVRFQLTDEGFRKKFRQSKPDKEETATQFVRRITSYLDRWVELSKTGHTYEELKDLLLREQFINACDKDLCVYLEERGAKDVQEMAHLAQSYLKAHGGFMVRGDREVKSRFGRQERDRDRKSNFDQNRKPVVTCYRCKKTGHRAAECRTNLNFSNKSQDSRYHKGSACVAVDNLGKNDKSDSHETTCLGHVSVATGQDLQKVKVTLDTGEELPLVGLLCDKARKLPDNLPVLYGMVNDVIVGTLRDTGCSGVVVKRSLVRDEQLTGNEVVCIMIDGTVRRCPMASIYVETPFYSGIVQAMCMDTPVYDLILGNIPGVKDYHELDSQEVSDKVVKDPAGNSSDKTVKQVQSSEEGVETVRKADLPETANVITRAQAKNKDKPISPLKVVKAEEISLGGDDLKSLQKKDESLKKYWKLAEEGKDSSPGRIGNTQFSVMNGLLYRLYQSGKIAGGNRLKQIVVPTSLREKVMRIAHDSIMGGHLGSGKTSERILSQFYWPNLYNDVVRYCQSCEVCQKTIPKGRIGKVPMQEMPLIEEPFKRVAIDLVGPIKPVTDRGNRYMLVLVDYATRYPEAVALPSIQTEVVAEALVSMFSRLGIPEEILSDHGTQFTSDLMKEVHRLLSIRSMTSSIYHPMCNGLVERFNGTLKHMLKKMCAERPRDWDRYIDALLFAYRETPQDSLGFSPFELMFGRNVRGPMNILKELWVKEDLDSEVKTTYTYVFELREKLEECLKIARDNLKTAQVKHKRYHDRKTQNRQFQEGDKVLVLLPTDSNKLLMQWKGPFTIECVKGKVDYRIRIDDQVKTFHANMLKKYFERTQDSSQRTGGVLQVSSVGVVDDDECSDDDISPSACEDIELTTLQGSENYQDVQINKDLSASQRRELQDLIYEFRDIFTDIPGSSKSVEHKILVSSNDPVRQKAYPIPHVLQKKVKEEVSKMLQLGVIERSDSAYASPVVLVKKKDSSIRFCVDYRRLNLLTIFDTEPMPNTEDVFAKVHNKKFFSKLDLSKGYWQIPMSRESRDLTTFVCSEGSFRYLKMPFGLVTAPATLNRLMRRLLGEIEEADSYMDDILASSEFWKSHMLVLRQVFTELKREGLTLRPSKCLLGFNDLDFVGHIVGGGKLSPHPDTVDRIKCAKQPVTKKQVRSFLGLVGFYRRYIPNFSTIAAPLTDLTKKGKSNKVEWGSAQERAFNSLKECLIKAPVLRLPDFSRSFVLQTDASDEGLGAILYQDFEDGRFPVAFASRKLLAREKVYAAIEKECLGLVWAVKKFQTYLYGTEFLLQTDHQPLIYINKTKFDNPRVMRWALALQPHRFRICSIKGTDNVGADYLSRAT